LHGHKIEWLIDGWILAISKLKLHFYMVRKSAFIYTICVNPV
jgi:hypothetical protein